MITGELKTKIDAVGNDFWSGLMRESAERHGRIVEAIRDQDGVLASTRAKRDILDHYGNDLDDDAARRLDLTLDEGRARAATST